MAGGAYLIIAFSFAFAGGLIGKLKGSSFWIWFMVSGAVPIFGLLAAVFYRNERTQDRMQCPGCGRIVPIHDTICTRCGSELYVPAEAEILPPEMPARR